jgi:hypothetical protein
VTISAYLFDVSWNDGLTSQAIINPEFESIESAQREAEKYGWLIGQLPTCLRKDVTEIWIHRGVEPFGGGNKSILIHTGQSTLYEVDGILEETLVHEASHTSLDAMHAESPQYVKAQNNDVQFISDYAKEFPTREDIAESFLLWIAVRYRADRISQENYTTITETIPNRLQYFDDIACDMYPIFQETSTAEDDYANFSTKPVIYPNPAMDKIFLKLDAHNSYRAHIYSSTGQLVKILNMAYQEVINISEFSNGLYYLILHGNNEVISGSFIKG